jgi:hypothetical protein
MLNGWNYQGDWEWINLLAKTALHIEKDPVTASTLDRLAFSVSRQHLAAAGGFQELIGGLVATGGSELVGSGQSAACAMPCRSGMRRASVARRPRPSA